MVNWRSSDSPLFLGFIVGLAFGSVNLLVTWFGAGFIWHGYFFAKVAYPLKLTGGGRA